LLMWKTVGVSILWTIQEQGRSNETWIRD